MGARGRPRKTLADRWAEAGLSVSPWGFPMTLEERILGLSPSGRRRWMERRLARDEQNVSGDEYFADFVWEPEHPDLIALRDEVLAARKARSEALRPAETTTPLTRQQKRAMARSEAKRARS